MSPNIWPVLPHRNQEQHIFIMTEQSTEHKTMKYLLLSLAGLGGGIFFFVLAIRYASFNPARFLELLSAGRPVFFLLMCLCILAHFIVSALKWKLLTSRLSKDESLTSYFILYTALTGLLGQFIPLQVATILVRTIAMRTHIKLPVFKGISSTVYDKSFDLLIFLLVFLSVIPVLFGYLPVMGAFFLSFLAFAGITVAFLLFSPYAIRLLTRGAALLNRIRGNRQDSPGKTIPLLFSRSTILLLWGLSLVRFANLVLVSLCVAWMFNMNIPILPLYFANGATRMTVLLGFVPGSIGIAEWSWLGVLSALGVSRDTALQYALLNRIAVALCVAVVTGLLWLYRGIFMLWSRRQYRRRKQSTESASPKSG